MIRRIDAKDYREHATSRQQAQTCLPLIGGCFIFCSLFTCGLWASTGIFLLDFTPLGRIWQNIEVNRQQSVWNQTGIESYKIVVDYSSAGTEEIFSTVVIDGEIVSGNRYFSYGMKGNSDVTITRLFERARECLRFCNVTYHSQYGFPERFVSGFVEGSVTQVIAFYPLTKAQ